MRTSHGHHIPGTKVDPDKPVMIARCGGPKTCRTCKSEVIAQFSHNTSEDQDIQRLDKFSVNAGMSKEEIEAILMSFNHLAQTMSRTFIELIDHLQEVCAGIASMLDEESTEVTN